MNTRHGDDTSHHLPWAEHTVNALNADDLARTALSEALDAADDLPLERSQQHAEALRAAAMGLPPAGCALAAGVSERMLTTWRDNDPYFNAAMASAQALAHAHRLSGSEAATTPFALRLFLRALHNGVGLFAASDQIGLSRHHLKKLRSRPPVEALVTAAQNLARKPAHRRAKPFTYRLVRTEPATAAPESG
ncbi:hypothetical protein ACFWWA_07935 [Streptomyces goshikiensis]|uniref:hypothetical protein n=1 Tax=Streptomyces goshikiensis TaxID=1942 RepID=UPI003658168F